jgi:hypothetical protein
MGCTGKHFLLGNPHTFPGRMLAWCPAKSRSFFVSRNEMSELSSESSFWVSGFLHGNEPAPPKNVDGDVDFQSPAYLAWRERADEFDITGVWVRET